MSMISIKLFLSNCDVDGYLGINEGILLYNNAKKCKRGSIVEIGSFCGKSTICLAIGSKEGYNKKIYAIDSFAGCKSGSIIQKYKERDIYIEFINNIKRYEVDDIIEIIKMLSTDAVKYISDDIELIFIDGSHEYEDVKNDFILYYPKVLSDGVMMFHDVNTHEGPRKLMKELKKDYDIDIIDNIGILKK